MGGCPEVKVHQEHVVGGTENLHQLDMVVHGADEHRGLVQFTGKINGQRAVHQFAEDLGAEALSEKTAKDGFARTRLRLPENRDRSRHKEK